MQRDLITALEKEFINLKEIKVYTGGFGERKCYDYILKNKGKLFKNLTLLKGNRNQHFVELKIFCLNSCNKNILSKISKIVYI